MKYQPPSVPTSTFAASQALKLTSSLWLGLSPLAYLGSGTSTSLNSPVTVVPPIVPVAAALSLRVRVPKAQVSVELQPSNTSVPTNRIFKKSMATALVGARSYLVAVSVDRVAWRLASLVASGRRDTKPEQHKISGDMTSQLVRLALL